MSATISTSSERPTATNAAQHTRFHSLSTHAMTLVSLLAVYAPPALVLLLNRSVIAKVYLVVGIWAIEGILSAAEPCADPVAAPVKVNVPRAFCCDSWLNCCLRKSPPNVKLCGA